MHILNLLVQDTVGQVQQYTSKNLTTFRCILAQKHLN